MQNLNILISKLDSEILQSDLVAVDGLYDATVNGQVSYRFDSSEPVNAVFGTRNDTFAYEASIEKIFKYGTSVQAGITGLSQDSNSPFVSLNPARNSAWFVRLRQSLWKNAFGSNISKQKKALKANIKASRLGLKRQTEIVFAQALAHLLEHWFYKQEKLMLLQSKRTLEKLWRENKRVYDMGLIELSQLKMIDHQIYQHNILLANNQENKNNVCFELKKILNIQSKLEQSAKNKQSKFDFCNDKYPNIKHFNRLKKNLKAILMNDASAAFESRADIKASEANIMAQKLLYQNQLNQSKPDLYLIADLAFNGVDAKYAQSWIESVRLQHPNVFLGVGLSFNLGNTKQKSELKKNLARQKQLALSMRQNVQNMKWEHEKLLEQIKNNEIKQGIVNKQWGNQKIVLKDEKKRFDQGKIELLELLQHEQTLNNIQLSKISFELRHMSQAIQAALNLGVLISYYKEL